MAICPQGRPAVLSTGAREAPASTGEQRTGCGHRPYLELEAWPDVRSALDTLKEAGIRLAFLSNMTARMLETGIRNARLEGMFTHVLSTDEKRTYKPKPRAYQMAVDAMKLGREEILFVAFAGWDAAGAKSFGFPTFWVNRLNLPEEELGARADGTGRDLADLVKFVQPMNRIDR